MKTKKIMMLLCSIVLLIASCSKEKSSEPILQPQSDSIESKTGNDSISISSNVAKPDWTAPTEHDYANSMTAVVKIDLAASFPNTKEKDTEAGDDDLFAAFVGTQCVGVGELIDGLYYIYISAPDNAEENQVTLKYYNTALKNIFTAKDVFSFKNYATIGTVSEPFTPTFTVEK